MKTTKSAALAFSTLPPDLQQELSKVGFIACRIEPSGALSMMISNGMSIAEKQRAVDAFRDISQQFGLDLKRVSMMARQGSLWDDGCLLVCGADAYGRRPKMFNQDGTPSQDVLRESASLVSRDRASRHRPRE